MDINNEMTPEEIERNEREDRREAIEKQLDEFRAEVKADDDKREKRRAERKRTRSTIYYILLALIIIGLVAYLIFNKELIWG